MRLLAALSFLWVGCHDFPKHAPDAGKDFPDAPETFPRVDASSFCLAQPVSNVSTNDGATFTRLDAGGVLESGGPFQFATPMSLSLWISNIDPLDPNTAGCCQPGVNMGCCPSDGLFAQNAGFDPATAIGDHSIMIQRFNDPSFSVSGTISITAFVDPFDSPPGHLSASLNATAASGSDSVIGTIDNDFCQLLLTVPI